MKFSNFNRWTKKQKAFVHAWDGDLKSSSEKAGISMRYAKTLLAKPAVAEAIRAMKRKYVNSANYNLTKKSGHGKVATDIDVLRFWTFVMNGDVDSVNAMTESEKGSIKKINMQDRLKASQYMGDYLGITQKVPQQQTSITAEDIVIQILNNTWQVSDSTSGVRKIAGYHDRRKYIEASEENCKQAEGQKEAAAGV
ncbi:MAG: terminase small subunit [Candidatus Syntrophoarchaeum sp.]|nr:terminase small subunit [Candidatus Syntrophoarchaeum sp.]